MIKKVVFLGLILVVLGSLNVVDVVGQFTKSDYIKLEYVKYYPSKIEATYYLNNPELSSTYGYEAIKNTLKYSNIPITKTEYYTNVTTVIQIPVNKIDPPKEKCYEVVVNNITQQKESVCYNESKIIVDYKKKIMQEWIPYNPNTQIKTKEGFYFKKIMYFMPKLGKIAIDYETEMLGFKNTWFNVSWEEANNFTVTTSLNASGTPTLLNITHNASMNNDFSDLRFIDVSGEILDYWFEYNESATYVDVWVELGSENDFAMYYKNPTAKYQGNFDNTFALGDEIISDTTSDYTTTGSPTFLYNASCRPLPNGEIPKCLTMNHPGGATERWLVSDVGNTYDNMTLVTRFRVENVASDFRIGNANSDKSLMAMNGLDGSGDFWRYYPESGGYLLGSQYAGNDYKWNRYNMTMLSTSAGTIYQQNMETGYVAFNNNSADVVDMSDTDRFFVYLYFAGYVQWDFWFMDHYIETLRYTVGNAYDQSGDVTPPTIEFVSQDPSDVTNINIIVDPVNITYNITDDNSINTDNVTIYYKTNNSVSNTFIYINGTAISGFQFKNVTGISGINFLFSLDENLVYPSTYNIDEAFMESTTHSTQSITSPNSYFKIQLLNVSGNKGIGLFEIMMSNISVSSNPSDIFYCNSSYVSGNPTLSANCVNFNSISPQDYDHEHIGGYSSHMVIPLPIDTTTNKVFDILVTETSYFLIRGSVGGGWDIHYISNVSRSDAIQTSGNSGNAWSNFDGTVDSHLHQYDSTENLWYYICASDIFDNTACSEYRFDNLDITPFPPTTPDVYSPVLGTYSNETIEINYTASISPNGFEILYYNISLYNTDFTINSSIVLNNSLNLTYEWDLTGENDGSYFIGVTVYDNESQSITGFSAIITINNNPIPETTTETTVNINIDIPIQSLNATCVSSKTLRKWYYSSFTGYGFTEEGCPNGCLDDLNEYGAGCRPVDYQLILILISLIIIFFMLIIILMKQR